MQFPSILWRKTRTKKIRVAHKVGIRSATEDLILSYNGKNYVWTLFYYRRSGGRLWRTGKRHSKVSAWRWTRHEIVASGFYSDFSGYNILWVDQKTILEIYRFWNIYLRNQGIEDPKLLGGIVTINENS